MIRDIDITSLLAGVSLTVVTGWIASFFALRKDERSIHIEQITKERTKWRENVRSLTVEICSLYSNAAQPLLSKEIAAARSKLSTFLNPKCDKDSQIIDQFDNLSPNDKDKLHKFEKQMALLLKHDWERAKWECTPIYIKPFIRFTKKQLAWRKDNYRELG